MTPEQEDDIEAKIAVLQILMADVTPDYRARMFQAVESELLIFSPSNRASIRGNFDQALTLCKDALDMADGTTPLGALSVRKVQEKLNGIHANLSYIAVRLHIEKPNNPKR